MQTPENFFELMLIRHIVVGHIVNRRSGDDAVKAQACDVGEKEGVILLVIR
jgi:hypothetical protein